MRAETETGEFRRMTRTARLVAHFTPAGLETDAEQRAQSVLVAGWMAAAVLSVVGLQYWWSFDAWQTFAVDGSIALLVAIGVPVYVRTSGRVNAAGHLLMALIWTALVAGGWMRPDFSWGVLWIALLPSLAAFVFSRRRHALLWGAVCGTTLVVFYVLFVTGTGPDPLIVLDKQQTASSGLVMMLALLVYAVGISMPATGSRRRFGEERDRLRTRLESATRLESLGRLSGEIAHDFANVLTAAIGAASVLEEALEPDSEEMEDLSIVLSALDRGRAMTKQLLTVARQGEVQPVPTAVNELVSEIQPLLRRMVGASIGLRTDLGAELGRVMIDPHQLHRVLLNLATNARDAMSDGGRLEFKTRRTRLRPDRWKGLAELPEGDYNVIEVRDDGAGIAPEVVDRIFEPFFTTKQAGHGTGLGLASCYGIIRQAGGDMAVTSKPGVGTTFRIALPVMPARRRTRTSVPPMSVRH